MTHRQILFVIYGLMAGMFLAALDQTVVGTSIKTIADDLDGLSLQAWVTTAYLMVSTISTPIYGKLSDIFGRRPLFIIAISIFLVGSLLAGIASSMYELAIFRAVQGLGAGGLMSLALTTMGDMLAPRDRAKYQGYFLAVFGVSSLIGPLIGGLLAGADTILFITGWRWVFLINLPIGLIALTIVLRFLHVPHTRRSVRIDWWGAVALIVATVPLLLIAEQGREWGWLSGGALACYSLGIAGIIAFVAIERMMGDDALLPLKLFRSSTFAMATLISVLVGFAMFGALTTIPLYLQLVNGVTPTESGLLTLPLMLGLLTASILSGQFISRTGKYKILLIAGTGVLTAGYLCLTFISADKPVWFMLIGMLLIGLGLGQLMQTLTLTSQNAVRARDIGVATSASTFFRQIGGTAGTAVLFSVLFTRLPDTITAAATDPTVQKGLQSALATDSVIADPNNAQILQLLQGSGGIGDALNGDTSFLALSDERLSAPFLVGFADASATVFTVGLAIAVVAFILSFFLKATPLRDKSALEQAAEDDIADAAALAAAGTVAPQPGMVAPPTDGNVRRTARQPE